MRSYQDFVQHILTNGKYKSDRTGTGTFAVFKNTIRHDLSKGFPLLTTKKVSFSNVLTELLMFLNGITNISFLHKNNCHIWDEWANEHGELGPVYGAQWRNWPCKDGSSIDQLSEVVQTLKTNPDSRRMVLTSWNPEYLPKLAKPSDNPAIGLMALAPCHDRYVFYHHNNVLSIDCEMRSSDAFLGLPYNIASVATLCHIVAHTLDMIPGEIVISATDSHLYTNHIQQAKLQLTREPYALPRLNIKQKKQSMFDYQPEDFEIVGYRHHPAISAPVAV